MKVVVHCTSNRVSAPLITSPSPMTGSGGIFAQTAAVLERNVLMRSLLLCVVVGCGKVGGGVENSAVGVENSVRG